MRIKPYLDQIDDVVSGRLGRRLQDPPTTPRPFSYYQGQVRADEQLYMALTEGAGVPPRLVAWVGSEETYRFFYGQYRHTFYMGIGLYAVHNDDAQE